MHIVKWMHLADMNFYTHIAKFQGIQIITYFMQSISKDPYTFTIEKHVRVMPTNFYGLATSCMYRI